MTKSAHKLATICNLFGLSRLGILLNLIGDVLTVVDIIVRAAAEQCRMTRTVVEAGSVRSLLEVRAELLQLLTMFVVSLLDAHLNLVKVVLEARL